MTTEKTVFEKIAAGEIPCTKIFEDEQTFVFLDINPGAKGHTLVIPKKPYKNIYELPDDEAAALMRTVVRISRAIKKALDCDGLNIIMNNEKAAGQIVFHAHIHLVPRKINDGGHTHRHLTYDEGEAAAIADKIKRCIE